MILFNYTVYMEENVEILEINETPKNKEKFMDLLLLGDEQENMIKKYLYRGELFALYDEDLKTVSVITKEDENIYEIKNIATSLVSKINRPTTM